MEWGRDRVEEMRYEVPMDTAYGEPSGYSLGLEQAADLIRLTIEGGFSGRDVEEELPKAALLELLSGGAQRNNDLLGLTLETDGGPAVWGFVSVGSDNIRFSVAREALAQAVDSLQ
jgi:hypothetical protein